MVSLTGVCFRGAARGLQEDLCDKVCLTLPRYVLSVRVSGSASRQCTLPAIYMCSDERSCARPTHRPFNLRGAPGNNQAGMDHQQEWRWPDSSQLEESLFSAEHARTSSSTQGIFGCVLIRDILSVCVYVNMCVCQTYSFLALDALCSFVHSFIY